MNSCSLIDVQLWTLSVILGFEGHAADIQKVNFLRVCYMLNMLGEQLEQLEGKVNCWLIQIFIFLCIWSYF